MKTQKFLSIRIVFLTLFFISGTIIVVRYQASPISAIAHPLVNNRATPQVSENLDITHLRENSSACTYLIGTGTNIRVAIVPWGFDDLDPADVQQFETLATTIANGFANIEPYTSNLDRISIWRADDYRGKDVEPDAVWYNPLLIQAAGACNYNQIIVIAHNSGWAGGAPGYYSVVGSGTPETCDPITCTGEGCPFMPSCSWDESIVYTALHETGHTFAGLRHMCSPASSELSELNSFERISGAEVWNNDPINCGVQYSGNPNVACNEWNNAPFYDWVLPNDQNFGCYSTCDGQTDWYRPWENTPNIMCRDDYLENGFTPVDRRLLFERLGGDRAGFCDWFSAPPLDSKWEWVDPLGDSQYTFTVNPDHISLQTPDSGHDLFRNTNAPRLLQRVGGDFSIQTQVTIQPVDEFYQGAGLLVWQDENNYVRLERMTDGIAFIYRVNGEYIHTGVSLATTPIYLKINRVGNTFTAWYHDNNDNWIQAGSIDFNARHEVKVGLHLINEWQDNPASADFDYFELSQCAIPLDATFSSDLTDGVAPLQISFINNSTGTYHNSLWDFGNGSTSTQPNPTYIYPTSGNYDVSLMVTGPYGSNTKFITEYITVAEPTEANFTAYPQEGHIPLSVIFTDQSSGAIDSWFWDFGDGSTSTQPNPTHMYTNLGIYTASLRVAGLADSDTLVQYAFITVTPTKIYLPMLFR